MMLRCGWLCVKVVGNRINSEIRSRARVKHCKRWIDNCSAQTTLTQHSRRWIYNRRNLANVFKHFVKDMADQSLVNSAPPLSKLTPPSNKDGRARWMSMPWPSLRFISSMLTWNEGLEVINKRHCNEEWGYMCSMSACSIGECVKK